MQTAHVAAVATFALLKGVPMAKIHERTGLRTVDLMRFDGRVPGHSMPRLWLLIEDYYPDQAISLEMAQWAPLSFLGTLGLVLGHLPAASDAPGLFAEHGKLAADMLQVTVSRGFGELQVRVFHARRSGSYGGPNERTRSRPQTPAKSCCRSASNNAIDAAFARFRLRIIPLIGNFSTGSSARAATSGSSPLVSLPNTKMSSGRYAT